MAKKCCVLILAATIAALALRLPRLHQRPMHGDEAIHADKFGMLLEDRYYEYDPNEYHGPTLNYLTLIPAWLTGAKNLVEVDEFTVRIVPVLMGVCLILLLLPMMRGLGTAAAVCAGVLTAISPAMVFYSRYYIQEMLLVCFTFGAIVSGYRYARSRNVAWAVSTGAFMGLMHASKETCIVAFASMFLALLLVLAIQRRDGSIPDLRKTIRPSHLVAGIAAGVIVSALFFSSFLSNPGGVVDSIRTYTTYLGRAGTSFHIHPWHYYLQMLLYFRFGGGPIWTEAPIVILAVVGFVAVMTRKNWPGADRALLQFIAFYTLVMTVVYCAIPYKTPWCLLGFLHGMILLAGVGAVVLVKLAPNVVPRLIILGLLVESCVLLTFKAYESSYEYDADSRNPYVYAHPTPEVFTAVDMIEQYASAHPDGYDMAIQVICAGDDYWPLPWYLRHFSSVSWRDRVVDEDPPAPLIIASASDDIEIDLARWLYELTPVEERQMYLYVFEKPYYVWLRPQVKLRGFVRKDLWTAWINESVPAVEEGEK
ncbi:MAG: flippase activity-associated protein Agl23 [Planctomycetota bacterium]